LTTLLDLISRKEGIYETAMHQIANLTFTFFLIYEQPNVVLSSFEKMPGWKEKLKPLYYGTIKILGKQDELIKMGSELNDRVDEIVKETIAERKKYVNSRKDG
jgi:hypothetical protein